MNIFVEFMGSVDMCRVTGMGRHLLSVSGVSQANLCIFRSVIFNFIFLMMDWFGVEFLLIKHNCVTCTSSLAD